MCFGSQHSAQAMRTHTKVPLSDMSTTILCHKHSLEVVGFCKEHCELYCPCCSALGEHKKCVGCTTIEEYLSTTQRILQKNTLSFEDRIKLFQVKGKAAGSQHLEVLAQEHHNIEAKIHSTAAELHKLVTAAEQSLIDESRRIQLARHDATLVRMSSLDNIISLLQRCREDCRWASTSSNPLTVLSALQCSELVLGQTHPSSLSISPSTSAASLSLTGQESVANALNSIGHVIHQRPPPQLPRPVVEPPAVSSDAPVFISWSPSKEPVLGYKIFQTILPTPRAPIRRSGGSALTGGVAVGETAAWLSAHYTQEEITTEIFSGTNIEHHFIPFPSTAVHATGKRVAFQVAAFNSAGMGPLSAMRVVALGSPDPNLETNRAAIGTLQNTGNGGSTSISTSVPVWPSQLLPDIEAGPNACIRKVGQLSTGATPVWQLLVGLPVFYRTRSCFEVEIIMKPSKGNLMIGIVKDGVTAQTGQNFSAVEGIGWNSEGIIYGVGNHPFPEPVEFSQGTKVGVAVDTSNFTVQFYLNRVKWSSHLSFPNTWLSVHPAVALFTPGQTNIYSGDSQAVKSSYTSPACPCSFTFLLKRLWPFTRVELYCRKLEGGMRT
ncbi:hypothetical protein Pelo_4396 [Pelomyxa schiedti]|nr:hypothetical protein Pelo_4396 [Pelomyxa schiedti]